jgi:preprotein translocase subunit SecG
MLLNFILVIHVMLAIAIVVLVLLQHGKGADMGAAFGTGSAGSLFGSSGAANFLSRSTAVCAGLFFVTSLGLTYFYAPKSSTGIMGGGVMQTAPAKEGTAGSIPVPTSGVPAATEPQKPAPQQIPK